MYASGANDLVHLLEDAALVFKYAVHISFLEYEQIAVAVKAEDYALSVLSPLVELISDGVAQVVPDALGLVLNELVEVVDGKYRHDGV